MTETGKEENTIEVSDRRTSTLLFNAGDYVAVTYMKKIYIIEYDSTYSEYHVTFMEQKVGGF